MDSLTHGGVRNEWRIVWGHRGEMTPEEAFKLLRIAAEGIRDDGNVTAALFREYPEVWHNLDTLVR